MMTINMEITISSVVWRMERPVLRKAAHAQIAQKVAAACNFCAPNIFSSTFDLVSPAQSIGHVAHFTCLQTQAFYTL